MQGESHPIAASPLPTPGPKRLHALRLARRDVLGPAYVRLELEAEAPLEARAGQFAMIRGASWGDAPLLARPMSLLTAGARPSMLVKVVGEGTRRLAAASAGDVLHLLAPLGRAWSPLAPGRRAVLVAGGVGVAPLVFLARELAALGAPRPLALYGARTAADLPLDDELAEVADLRVATEDGSRGERGRVTVLVEAALDELASRAEAATIFTCGPDRMMAAVAAIAAARGVPCEASLEAPMACGYGVCLGCPVRKAEGGYLYACTEGPCVDAATIDWSRGA